MEEIWKDIKNYEGFYQVSNKGNVKSLNYNHTGKEKLMKLSKYKNGYLCVHLHIKEKNKTFLIHRLVAEAFISNPNNYSEINHINGNKSINNYLNLEWISHAENIKHAYKNKLIKSHINNHIKSTPIKCLDLETNATTYYPSIHEASRQMNICLGSICYSIYKSKSSYKNRYIFTEIKEIEN